MLVFLIIHWREDGLRRSEAFGPWAALPDGSHLSEIAQFGRLWVARFPDRSITASELYIPTNPGLSTSTPADMRTSDATRVVLIKPGDALVLGNISLPDDDEAQEALNAALSTLKNQLGLAGIVVCAADVTIAARAEDQGGS